MIDNTNGLMDNAILRPFFLNSIQSYQDNGRI